MSKIEHFPINKPELEKRSDYYADTFQNIEKILNPEHYAWQVTVEQMEGFIDVNETNYEKLRIFFSNYTPKLIENYYRYILKDKNVQINNFCDVVTYYSLFQRDN